MVRKSLSDDHLIQLKVVNGTLNARKYQDEILESGVRSPFDSLDGQNMVLRDAIARPHCICIIEECKNQQNIASLQRGASCLTYTCTPFNTCGTSSADVFETGNEPYENHCLFCQTLLHEWDRISCHERMYPVNLMMKMFQVLIRQGEGYTRHKPGVVDYYEPFRDFLHQILKVYAPKRKF